ncbi:MAG: hypothetical protein QOH96_1767 [Blastocatellia bacterium]|jgi:hypothetical protein|nr:hypothetical protein [Blastocatellia bacterium]
MIAEETVEELIEKLFSDEANVYVVLDGASVPGLLQKLYQLEPEYICLLRGDLAPDMAEVAPYLVRLEKDDELIHWILENGWGKHWGIFGTGYGDIREMRGHFRSFLTVYDESGNPLNFRYYDPRVWRLYLPTCNSGELKTVFGPVAAYYLEDEDANTLLRFELNSESLRRRKFVLR